MATRSNYSSLVNSLSDDGLSEYLGPDGIWYPVGQGPGSKDVGAAPIDRPIVDTGLTQTPKVAGAYNGPALPPGGLPDYSAYEAFTGRQSAGGGPLAPGAMPEVSSFVGAAPETTRVTPGSLDAVQAEIKDITRQAGGGLAETVKDVGAERATASPRGMFQLLNAQDQQRRKKFGAPVNMQALLSQL